MNERKKKKTDTLTLKKKHACRERIKELVKHCRKIKQKQKEATKELNKQVTGTMCGQLWVLQAFIEANE